MAETRIEVDTIEVREQPGSSRAGRAMMEITVTTVTGEITTLVLPAGAFGRLCPELYSKANAAFRKQTGVDLWNIHELENRATPS